MYYHTSHSVYYGLFRIPKCNFVLNTIRFYLPTKGRQSKMVFNIKYLAEFMLSGMVLVITPRKL